MKRRILLALGFAFPLEGFCFVLLMPPLDVGYPPGTSWWVQLMGLLWGLLHWIGLRAMDLLQGTRLELLSVPVLFVGGYLEMAFLLLFILSIRPLIRRMRARSLFTAK